MLNDIKILENLKMWYLFEIAQKCYIFSSVPPPPGKNYCGGPCPWVKICVKCLPRLEFVEVCWYFCNQVPNFCWIFGRRNRMWVANHFSKSFEWKHQEYSQIVAELFGLCLLKIKLKKVFNWKRDQPPG